MPLVPLRVVLDHAAENSYGVAAFNVNNMEQIQSIMMAADETDSPVIIQASRGARAYSQDAYLRHLMLAAVELYPHIPIVMHQDHGNSPATCRSAIDNGFTSVMMDGSLKEDGKTPADYAYNVRVTSEVVAMAHSRGVSVEGELGCLGSLEHGEGEQEDGHGAVGKGAHHPIDDLHRGEGVGREVEDQRRERPRKRRDGDTRKDQRQGPTARPGHPEHEEDRSRRSGQRR